MGRTDAARGLKADIRGRYRETCAACGDRGRLVADVAHLYEDATRHPPSAATLIILCASCNQAQARYRGRNAPPLSQRFTANEVACRASAAHRAGEYHLAYQGFRLSAYLHEQEKAPSRAVERLTEAISALRPIRWGDFLAATVCESERLCRAARVGLVQRWLFLDRLALVLFDYGRWREAGDVREAAGTVRSQIGGDERYPEDLWFDVASSFRREAMIRALTTPLSGRAVNGLIARLLEDAREFRRVGQLDAFATNLDVAGKLELELRGNPRRAHEFSVRALELAPRLTHNWVLQEHEWREAVFFRSRRDRARTAKHVVEALALFGDHPVVLEPRRGPTGPVLYDPIAALAGFGVPVEELRDRGVAPRGNSPPILPLELSPKQIERIVRAAIAT